MEAIAGPVASRRDRPAAGVDPVHSTTFGTTIIFCRRAGAFMSACSTVRPGSGTSSAQTL
jgi:hypothetical protein